MKNLFFCLFVFFITLSFTELKAQESKPVPNDNPALKEEAMKVRAKRMEAQKTQAAPSVTSKPVTKSPIDEDDIYMGRKAEFLGNMTVTELPADFPKYDKSYGQRYYNNLVDNFYESHKTILKDFVRMKIEGSNPH